MTKPCQHFLVVRVSLLLIGLVMMLATQSYQQQPPQPGPPNADQLIGPKDATSDPERREKREGDGVSPPPEKDGKDKVNPVELTLNSAISQYYVSLTVIVPSATYECYFYRTGGPFVVQYEVVGGSGPEIGVQVSDQFGVVVREDPPRSNGEIKVDVEHKMLQSHYRICLDNRQGNRGPRNVFLNVALDKRIRRELLVAMQETGRSLDDNHKAEVSLVKFYDSVNNVDGDIQNIFRLQHRYRGLEYIDRHIMEANKARVTQWSAFQLVVMLLVSMFQVVTIRSLFDDRSRVAKVMRRVWALVDRICPRWLAPTSPSVSPSRSGNGYQSKGATSVPMQRASC